jgi:hypothetical protein
MARTRIIPSTGSPTALMKHFAKYSDALKEAGKKAKELWEAQGLGQGT